jgi:hypothetical protein
MGEKGESWMTTMIERAEGHYEVQKTSYGEAYVWCPGYVVVECECGQRLTLGASDTVCSCGAEHETLVREELAFWRSSDEILHPWDDGYREWRKKQDEYLRTENNEWLEWRVIE